jgi:hypothetical protein
LTVARQAAPKGGAAVNLFGVSIGVFVGLISAVLVLPVMRVLSGGSVGDAKSVKTLVLVLLTVIAIVGSASFLVENKLVSAADTEAIAVSYYTALIITFAPFIAYPLLRLTFRYARELGQGQV